MMNLAKLSFVLYLILSPFGVSAESIEPNNDGSQYAYGEDVGWFNAEPGGDDGSEPAQATLPLESVFVPEAEGEEGTSDAETLSTTIILNETFEGGFPGTGWTLYGTPTWDDTSYDKHGGASSAWCGGSALNPADGYTNNMYAWMVYGPFSLADAASPSVYFWYRNRSETGHDYFWWAASRDGWGFAGTRVSGDQNTWRFQVFDLTNVPVLGDLSGQSQVWIAFLFESDGSVCGDPGAFVDDIVITKDFAAPTPDIKANGSDGPLTISKAAENLVVTISLDPGDYDGTNADWWVRALRQSNGDTWWYVNGTGWVKSVTPIRAYGGKLRSVAPLEVWNGSIPVDIWLFHFAVDTDRNNILDSAPLYWDKVKVTVNP